VRVLCRLAASIALSALQLKTEECANVYVIKYLIIGHPNTSRTAATIGEQVVPTLAAIQ
jgi:hypothetical protein